MVAFFSSLDGVCTAKGLAGNVLDFGFSQARDRFPRSPPVMAGSSQSSTDSTARSSAILPQVVRMSPAEAVPASMAVSARLWASVMPRS